MCIRDRIYGIDNLPAGDYVYRVSVRGVYAEDIPVKVKSVAETDNQEIKSGTNNLKNQDKMVLKYTAPADGRYELETNVPITGFKVASGSGDTLVDCVIENYRTYADFEKDTDYYIFVTADEYCPELKVTVSPVTRPVSMETKALKKDYIAGIDYFKESYMETKIDSGNKKSRTVRGSDLVNGYYLHYKLTNAENETYNYYDPLTLGTWTVSPYLSASIQTGSAISAEMSELPVTTDTVTAKMLDLKSLPSLKADTWENIGNTGYQEKYYAFTAPEDGTYTYEADASGGGNISFYTEGEQGYERNGYSITLKKGETCLAAAYSGANSKVKIVKSGTVSKEPTETLLSLIHI